MVALPLTETRVRAPARRYDDASGCFTRAARYELDHKARTARLAWQFEFRPDFSQLHGDDYAQLQNRSIYVSDGGSLRMYGGHYLVAFTVTCAEQAYGKFAWVFEVDDAGVVHSEVRVGDKGSNQRPPNRCRGLVVLSSVDASTKAGARARTR